MGAMQTRWFSSIKPSFLRSCVDERNSWHNFIASLAAFSHRHQVPIFSYRENCESNLKTSRCPNLMLAGFVSKMLASPPAWRIPLGRMPKWHFTKDFYCPTSLVSTFHRAFLFLQASSLNYKRHNIFIQWDAPCLSLIFLHCFVTLGEINNEIIDQTCIQSSHPLGNTKNYYTWGPLKAN